MKDLITKSFYLQKITEFNVNELYKCKLSCKQDLCILACKQLKTDGSNSIFLH